MEKPAIDLFDAIGTGIIIEWPSGVCYTNQAGGNICLRPALECVYVPIANELQLQPVALKSPENELFEYFTGPKYGGGGATSGIDAEDASAIEEILDGYQFEGCLEVDRARLQHSCEAWVWVTILSRDSIRLLNLIDFEPYPRRGVLTWNNGD